jgi:hypothetical protein
MFDQQDFSLVAVPSPFLGEGLNIPKGFWIPGTLSSHIGHFGIGSQVAFGQASLAAGQGPYPFALRADGNSAANGVWTTTGVHNIVGSTNLTGNNFYCGTATADLTCGNITLTSGAALTATAARSLNLTSVNVNISSAGALNLNGRNWDFSAAFWDSKKGFDIPHPTKKDHRLRYICVEGPSAEVYLRGKLKDNNIIELPEYWRNLVDVETIGVSLTSIGHYQELFVEKIEWGTKIIVKNNSGAAINCSYVVFAERKDTSKNIPEYKGLTPADYPGDNREYVINGKSYL